MLSILALKLARPDFSIPLRPGVVSLTRLLFITCVNYILTSLREKTIRFPASANPPAGGGSPGFAQTNAIFKADIFGKLALPVTPA